MPETIAMIIPCYNEVDRLSVDEVLELVEQTSMRVLLVDDGSTDGTRELHDNLVARDSRISALALPENRGKAEAVRIGMLHAIGEGVSMVGYADADFATPASELIRLSGLAKDLEVTLGARVALLGVDIQRSVVRHLLGRVFATCASFALDLPVYDTQCGAKFFRVTSQLCRALERPFSSRWAFDVELLGRLLDEGVLATSIHEIPLQTWHDKKGSKLQPFAMVKSGLDVLRISRRRFR